MFFLKHSTMNKSKQQNLLNLSKNFTVTHVLREQFICLSHASTASKGLGAIEALHQRAEFWWWTLRTQKTSRHTTTFHFALKHSNKR
jgi:hypothetical protein